MEIILGLAVVGFLIWLLVRGNKREEERKRLRSFRFTDETPETIHSSWHIDLVDMTGTRRYFSADDPRGHTSAFGVRRADGGWEIKLAEAAWRDEVLRVKKNIARGSAFTDMFEEQLAELGDRPSWERMNEALSGPLESQYQRFVRQYRGDD